MEGVARVLAADQALERQREALRCSRDGIRINTFMIEGSPALEDFVGEMTGLVQGRAFMTDPNRLGEYVLLDYVSQRRKRVA